MLTLWVRRVLDRLRHDAYTVDMPRLILTGMAVMHGIIVITFGIGLFASVSASISPSYIILSTLPGWPLSVGAIYFFFGCVVLYSRVRKDELSLLSTIAFLGLSLTSLLYGTLFLAGTRNSHGVYGPQSLYLGFATLYLFHAIYSFSEWLKERWGSEDVSVPYSSNSSG